MHKIPKESSSYLNFLVFFCSLLYSNYIFYLEESENNTPPFNSDCFYLFFASLLYPTILLLDYESIINPLSPNIFLLFEFYKEISLFDLTSYNISSTSI